MARDFNSTGSLNIGRAQVLEITGDMSVSVLQYDDDSFESPTIGCYNPSGAFEGWGLRTSTSNVSYWSDGIGSWQASSGTLTASQWNQYGFTINGTGAGAGTFYLNGSSSGTWTHTAPGAYTGTDKRIGATAGSTSGCRQPLAEVAVWDNVVLDAAEMAALGNFVSPLLIRPHALVAYWPIYGRNDPEQDYITGNGGTVTGTAAQFDHPLVINPSGPFIPSLTAAGGGPTGTSNLTLLGVS